jgi:DNA-binding transcriptional LysR family regulator
MADKMIDLRALAVFMEVNATRSMTVASARLGLTQSAVSQTLRKLEVDLGFSLIKKGQRPLKLTKSGEVLARSAETLLREAARIPHLLAEASAQPKEIRIGLVDTFASTAGPELTRELMRSATRVVVWSGLTPSLGSALLQNEVDVIITSDPLDDMDGLARLELWKEPFVLLLPRSDYERLKTQSLAELAASMPIIRYSARSHTGIQIERHLRRLNLNLQRRIEVDGSDAVLGMVAAGVGWAIATPLCLLQGIAHSEGVVAVQLPAPRFSRTLVVMCRNDGPLALASQIAELAAQALRRTCLARLEIYARDLARQIEICGESSATPIKSDA